MPPPGRPILAAQSEPRRPLTLWEFAAPDDSRHAGHRRRAAFPPPRRLPAAARRLRAPSRLSLRCSQSGRALRPDGRGQQGEASAQSGNRCAPPQPKARSLAPASRPRLLCDRLQPLRAGTPRPLSPGLQMAPARLCASRRSPSPGTSGGAAPGPYPAATARGAKPAAPSPAPPPAARLAGPCEAAPTPRPPSARAARSHLPRAAAQRRVARAGWGEDSWFSAGEIPPFEAVPLRPKTSSPNVRETKGIC